jgi:hypothetical protein
MKTKKYSFVIAAIVAIQLAALFFISSCKPDEPTAQEVNRKKLMSGTWRVAEVKVDGVNQTSLFTGMTLQFTKDQYTSTNGDPVWPASGTWEFEDAKATMISRDDGIFITIEAITNSELVLSLTWDENTYSGGRQKSIAGPHVFKFTK